MPTVTILRTPEWASASTLPPGAVIALPASIADPLLAAGQAVHTPGAAATHDNPFGAGVVAQGGADYLTLSDGSLMPLSIMAGTPHEPTVAGVVQQVVSLDHGSDADHVEILLTLNCTTGDPDTPDTALASARFTAPDGNAEVVKSGVVGASAGTVMAFHAPGGITCMHFGLRGAGPYTAAAGNTLTALQMVVMQWADALAVDTIEVRIGTATVGGGANKRYRVITVTGYAS